MEDLELLKNDWNKNQNEFKNFSEDDIYKMIKKKSVSLSQIIFVVGLFEIIVWFTLNYFYPFNYPMMRYVIFAVFVVLIIYNYYKIRTESNAKKLMQNILWLRKSVILYVVLTLLIILFDIIKDFDIHVRSLLAGWMSGEKGERYSVNPEDVTPGVMSYCMFILATLLLFGILLFIYQKTYGKLLKKLKFNYKELTKLEESNV